MSNNIFRACALCARALFTFNVTFDICQLLHLMLHLLYVICYMFNLTFNIMDKRSLENRLFLFAASRNLTEETCRVVRGEKTPAIYLHVLSNCVSSDFISDVRNNICSDFSIFVGVFEPNTLDFIFVYDS